MIVPRMLKTTLLLIIPRMRANPSPTIIRGLASSGINANKSSSILFYPMLTHPHPYPPLEGEGYFGEGINPILGLDALSYISNFCFISSFMLF